MERFEYNIVIKGLANIKLKELNKLLDKNGEYTCYSKIDGYKTNNNKKSIFLDGKKELENCPGVYVIYKAKDKAKEVYYIGETLHLRERLQEHFHFSTPNIFSNNEEEFKDIRKEYKVKIIPLTSSICNKTKYELRAIEQLVYLTLNEDRLYKWDGLKSSKKMS